MATLPAPAKPQTLTLLEAFGCGGLAGCAAVTVSNVPEVMKTRLQLQGELMKVCDPFKLPDLLCLADQMALER